MIFIRSLTFAFAITASLFTASAVYATDDHKMMDHSKMAAGPTADQDAWLAKAKAAYPLDTCVVSDEKLEGGDMGAPVDFVYKQEGKPDRLVRFCCKNCIKKFKNDPAKYLKILDDAAAAKASGNSGHAEHMH
jgi:hypothetical protein